MREILFAINFSFVLCELKTETTAADGAETESRKQWARERKYLGKIIQISWLWVCIEGKTMKQSPKLIKIYANTKRASERERVRKVVNLLGVFLEAKKMRKLEHTNYRSKHYGKEERRRYVKSRWISADWFLYQNMRRNMRLLSTVKRKKGGRRLELVINNLALLSTAFSHLKFRSLRFPSRWRFETLF